MISVRQYQESTPGMSLAETVKAMDEMDRLLNEMKQTMDLIKKIIGEGEESQEILSLIEKKPLDDVSTLLVRGG